MGDPYGHASKGIPRSRECYVSFATPVLSRDEVLFAFQKVASARVSPFYTFSLATLTTCLRFRRTRFLYSMDCSEVPALRTTMTEM